ncbi:MAG: beta-lactamase family protein [Candidatus Bathyarchaeum sp.]|nr:MAG: beta-lactamase family protein [Candidatus Bathyarchaeum sp.]
MTKSIHISGFVKPEFEAVRETFEENFECRDELGAACCIYHRGEKVVDLWGGVRNESTGEPWEENTMVIMYSTTKGLAGLAMALANSQGLFDYDERVSTYWPEFAQQGKDKITIRELLAHQAGLYAFDEMDDKNLIADLDRLAVVLAKQKPAYEPGSKQDYHALTLGFYENEIIRRTDPQGRSIGQYFQEEIASPLGLDFYIRLPEEIPNSRLATTRQPKFNVRSMFTLPFTIFLAAINPRSAFRKSLVGSLFPLDKERIYARNFEVPSGGGVGTARAIAHAYSVFATGGKELGLKEKTLKQLMAPAVPPLKGFPKHSPQFSLGFFKPSPENPFGHPSSFGAPGTGGSFGFADPKAKIGYGYVLNGMGTYITDPRDIALRKAMYRSIGAD